MAYDYAGSWDPTAGHQSNIHPSNSNPTSTPFSTVRAIEYYKSHGVASSKIVLGMPLYGRAFASTDGPGKPFSGTGEGSWEQGVWDYKALPQKEGRETNDFKIGASWSYDAEKRLMVSYDTKEMAKFKAEWLKGHGRLGGAMWWESSGDKGGEDSIIGTVRFDLIPNMLNTNYPIFPRSITFSGARTWIVATIRYHIQSRSMITFAKDFPANDSRTRQLNIG